MTVCYFGDYNSGYNRTAVLMRGLRLHGVKILECNEREKRGLSQYISLFKKHHGLNGEYDLMIVGYGDNRVLPVFARFLTRRPVVWEPLYSFFDNLVVERHLVKKNSLRAVFYYLTEWLASRVSDSIILDTEANIRFFANLFHIDYKKFICTYVGSDDSIMKPRDTEKSQTTLEVEFHGKFLPLHGLEYVLHAAKLLEHDNVHFTLIGGGQESGRMKMLAKNLALSNVTFLPAVPFERLPEYIANADISLGILGVVPSVDWVLPNKLYETAAMKIPMIHAESIPLKERWVDGKDVIMVPRGNAQALAQKIRYFLTHRSELHAVGEAAYLKFHEEFTPRILAGVLLSEFYSRFPFLVK